MKCGVDGVVTEWRDVFNVVIVRRSRERSADAAAAERWGQVMYKLGLVVVGGGGGDWLLQHRGVYVCVCVCVCVGCARETR